MSNQKLDIANKIKEFESKGLFDQDIFVDPPTRELKPGEVDYKYQRFSTKIAAKLANFIAKCYFDGLIRKHQLIIKEVKGIRNFRAINHMGAIITSNHFHPFDNYAVYKAIEKQLGKRRLYKVIREGNYTNFPGLYGYFFKHCNTLPLSSNIGVMKEFYSGVKYHLENGEKILIYPEQALWPNYKKPRPLKPGAFSFAVSNQVPVLPMFITFNDSEYLDKENNKVQEYTVHILEPVFPEENVSYAENVKRMSEKVFNLMKEKYEEVYQIPLRYEE